MLNVSIRAKPIIFNKLIRCLKYLSGSPLRLAIRNCIIRRGGLKMLSRRSRLISLISKNNRRL